MAPRNLHQALRLMLFSHVKVLGEDLTDGVAVMVHRRRQDMHWMLMIEVDDEIAHIRHLDLMAMGVQIVLQPDFLAHHGLGFDDARDMTLSDELLNDGTGISGVLGIVNLDAILSRLSLKLLDQSTKMLHRCCFELLSLGAHLLPLREVLS